MEPTTKPHGSIKTEHGFACFFGANPTAEQWQRLLDLGIERLIELIDGTYPPDKSRCVELWRWTCGDEDDAADHADFLCFVKEFDGTYERNANTDARGTSLLWAAAGTAWALGIR